MRKNLIIPNGRRIAQLRKRLELTQVEFAKLVGFSFRVIQKAEASKSIEKHTLVCIAETLSIDIETISYCPMAIAAEWIELYKTLEIEMASQIEHLIHPEVTMIVEGDASVIPFAGEFHGREGISRFMHEFFNVFTRPDKKHFDPQFATNEEVVVAIGEELLYCEGFRIPVPGKLTLTFEFRNQLIYRITDQFDTLGAANYLAEVEVERKRTPSTEEGSTD